MARTHFMTPEIICDRCGKRDYGFPTQRRETFDYQMRKQGWQFFTMGLNACPACVEEERELAAEGE